MNASDAKRASEAFIGAAGLMVNPNLPEIEAPCELAPRSAREVAIRAWVLAHIVYLGYGNTGAEIVELLTNARLEEHLTPNELNFCAQDTLTSEKKAWAAWLCEAVHGCAWSLGMVDTAPLDDCPDNLVSLFPVATDPWPSIEAASLRRYDQLYQRADMMYRLHWAAVEARLSGALTPLVEPAIMMQRHSLDWVVGLPHEWDSMPLDT
jgi:Domain of unknown function (DUF4272)